MLTSIVLALLMQAASPAQAGQELTGVVVDAQGQPAAGVAVYLSSLDRVDGEHLTLGRTTSDGKGQFRLAIPAAGRKGVGISFPTVWADRPGTSLGIALLRTAAARVEGGPQARADAPIKLTLGSSEPVSVRVLDPQGQPIDGARVSPVYVEREEKGLLSFGAVYHLPIPAEIAGRLAVTTDAHGIAKVADLPSGGLRYARVETPRFGTQTVLLQGRSHVARLGAVGRLVGQVKGDNPAAAQGLRMRVETHPSPPSPGKPYVYAPDGAAEAIIDASGRFEVPALAAGMLSVSLQTRDNKPTRDIPVQERAIEPGKTTELIVPLPGLTHEHAIEGRVVDRQGKPVAGAVVFQSGDGPTRTRAASHDDGRFRLDGFNVGGSAFLFVKKRGFRFHGQGIGETPGPVTLTLTRTDEKPAVVLHTRPAPLPHKEELALAHRVLDAYADKVLKGGDLSDKVQTLEALARVEPERVLQEAEKGKFPDPLYNEMFRQRVIEGMVHDDPDAAAEVAEASGDPMVRAMAYVAIADAIAATPENRARRLAWLDQALLHARGIKEGDKRPFCLGQVAERWLDLGETDKATKLLREEEKLARELPNAAFAGYARASFAEELAQIDLDAALALTKDLSDPREYDRHHGNIAHELAGKDPAAAERVLAMVRDQRQRDSMAIRVCYRMAPVDLARARRIAGSIQHTLMKPYALGMMAQALAVSVKTRPVAAELLAAAFDEMASSVEAGKDEFNNMESGAVTASSLLPVAEAIDPTLVSEYLWRSISFRRPTPGPESQPNQSWFLDAAAAALAMRVARYDPETARALVDPIAHRLASKPNTAVSWADQEVIVAMGLISPQKAVALLEQFPDAPPKSALDQIKTRSRLALAVMLARSGERRWKYLQWHYFHNWVPDIEDLVGPF
jgi:hypothetical protein